MQTYLFVANGHIKSAKLLTQVDNYGERLALEATEFFWIIKLLIGILVYRKPSHTDRYPSGTSFHHPTQKRAVLS